MHSRRRCSTARCMALLPSGPHLPRRSAPPSSTSRRTSAASLMETAKESGSSPKGKSALDEWKAAPVARPCTSAGHARTSQRTASGRHCFTMAMCSAFSPSYGPAEYAAATSAGQRPASQRASGSLPSRYARWKSVAPAGSRCSHAASSAPQMRAISARSSCTAAEKTVPACMPEAWSSTAARADSPKPSMRARPPESVSPSPSPSAMVAGEDVACRQRAEGLTHHAAGHTPREKELQTPLLQYAILDTCANPL